MSNISQIKLNGCHIPVVGIGTWQLKGDEAQESVETALSYGYRLIDTADVYGNHKQIAKAINNSKIDRSEIFLTTKVWRDDLKCKDIREAVDRFLDELDTNYIDLLLVHWPNSNIPYEETIDGLDAVKDDEKILDYGVSNFTIKHLKELKEKELDYDIVNNQVEFHPSLNQKELQKYCNDNGIVVTAYSPIAQGKDFDLELIQNLAEKYDKTPAQIILNWHIANGRVVIPRSSTNQHIKENFEILTWRLEEEDIEKIENINKNNRLLKPPFHEFDK